MKKLVVLLLLAVAPLGAQPAAEAPVPLDVAVAVQRYPHDPGAFTQGLFIDKGELFESTGKVGSSSVRKVDLKTGRVLRQANIPAPHFGEGIAPWKGQLLSLTWQGGTGFRWDRKSFKKIGTFRYQGEGWALTSTGTQLVMSDGSDVLRFIDPTTFKEKHKVSVTFKGQPLREINEIEWIDGQVWANIWHTDYAVRIDPASGRVVRVIDLSALHQQAGTLGREQVANGIAWDARSRKLYMTGKEWPWLYEVRVEPSGRQL
jgi:glutamine cyclotransferase